MRRRVTRVQLGDAVYATSHTNPPGPRLWSGNAADPQVTNTRPAAQSDDVWLWIALAVMLSRR